MEPLSRKSMLALDAMELARLHTQGQRSAAQLSTNPVHGEGLFLRGWLWSRHLPEE